MIEKVSGARTQSKSTHINGMESMIKMQSYRATNQCCINKSPLPAGINHYLGLGVSRSHRARTLCYRHRLVSFVNFSQVFHNRKLFALS